MAISLKICIYEPMLAMPKCFWDDLSLFMIITDKQLKNGKKIGYKTHLGFTNMGPKMHIFRDMAISMSTF